MTELQQFLAMLERASIAHGQRVDYNPTGTAVLVEVDEVSLAEESSPSFVIVEFGFDADGKLRGVACYLGEVG